MAGEEAATEAGVRAHLARAARACLALGSPFTAGLCTALAAVLDRSTETGRRVLAWPGDPERDALALRLCAGLHALVLAGRDRVLASAFPPRSAGPMILAGILPGAVSRHDGFLAARLDRPPQTNEVGRAALLLPGFLTIARQTGLPLSIHEIGASAGLNLLFDRFGYRYGDDGWGEADAPIRLAPEMRGERVPLDGALCVAGRAASDVSPLDVGRPEDRLLLRSFVWPDQGARLERLDAAIRLAAAAARRLRPVPMDAAEAVAAMLAGREDGVAAVLCHSILWQYLPDATKRAIVEAMVAAGEAATARRPLAWLRLEPRRGTPADAEPVAALSLTLWPGGQTRHLADADFHGRWIAWR